MAPKLYFGKFYFDPAGLPPGLQTVADQDAYQDAVSSELENSHNLPKRGNSVEHAAVIGMLLRDERFDSAAAGFGDAIFEAAHSLIAKNTDYNGKPQPNRNIYRAIDAALPGLNHPKEVAFQELASIAQYILDRIVDVPLGHPNFTTQVRLGVDSYVAGEPTADSLELPPLTGADGQDVEIEPDNIHAVAMVYAGHQLEQLRLFDVCDRVTEIFMNGMLPVGMDAGGRALDKYYWEAEDRLTRSARHMQYSRMLGAPGGDVSREVQPNKEFNGLWLRFLSSLSEYDRQQRVADIIRGGAQRPRALNLTGEHVRKAGRDLAANLSLYGYGYSHFAARRINGHVGTAIGILKLAPIQKAYGVSNPWQVVERVAAAEFGQAPNVVRYRTMAEAGKRIMDLIAKHHTVWSGSSGQPLFQDPNFPNVNGDIDRLDQEILMRETEHWLAVNGIKDDQVDQYSQPEESALAPSLPSFGGSAGGGNGKPAGGNGTLDQLRQMVAQGQTPSLDQLRSLLPVG